MPESVQRIASLILKYWRQELDEEELNELLDWANHSPASKEAFTRLTNPDFIVDRLRELSTVKQEMRDRIWMELQLADPRLMEHDDIAEKNSRKYPFRFSATWKWAMAVLMLLVSVSFLFWFTGQRPGTTSVIPEVVDAGLVKTPDLLALKVQSRISFADGRWIEPAAMTDGAVLEHGRLKLVKEPGGVRISNLTHNRTVDSTGTTTVTTFEGGKITIWLPDGTEVNMNTASSLRFPELFNELQRTVEASGELYFQVARQNIRGMMIPFVVYTSGMNMEAFIASFNVHVYPMEKLATATLEEGSLRVWKQVPHSSATAGSKDKVDMVLEPGQQAQISNDTDGRNMGGIRVEQVNPEEVTKWRSD